MSELINLLGGESEWAEHQLKEVFEFEQNLSKVGFSCLNRYRHPNHVLDL